MFQPRELRTALERNAIVGRERLEQKLNQLTSSSAPNLNKPTKTEPVLKYRTSFSPNLTKETKIDDRPPIDLGTPSFTHLQVPNRTHIDPNFPRRSHDITLNPLTPRLGSSGAFPNPPGSIISNPPTQSNKKSPPSSNPVPPYSPSLHYNSNVAKSINYQSWASGLVPAPVLPTKFEPKNTSSMVNTSMNTLNSFLNRNSRSELDQTGKIPVSRPTSSTHRPLMEEARSCPSVGDNLDFQLNIPTDFTLTPRHPHSPPYTISNMTITNQTPRSKLLVTSDRGTFTSKKIKTSPIEFGPKRRPRNLRTRVKMNQNEIFANTRHVSSIPNQNSRIILDESLAILNSTSQTSRAMSAKRKETMVLSSTLQDSRKTRCALPPHKHIIQSKKRTTGSARSRKAHPTEQLTSLPFKQLIESPKNLTPDINIEAIRKNSMDSGNGTNSTQSGRSCGDGTDDNLNENLVKPGTQNWPTDEKVDYNYSDSDTDESDGGVVVDEEFIDEFMDGVSCCQDNDSGEFVVDDDIDCVDDDAAINFLEDDNANMDDAGSEYSTSTSASRSTTSIEQHPDMKPALIKSIFSNCPPVINFATKFEQIESLPSSIRKLLKWKMSSITPIVVRGTVMKSGFKPSKRSHDWLGYFGKHMKSHGFRSIREYQKINHFPGSFQLGRKDRLWRNISRMQTRFGKKEFGFVPQTYIMPWDKKLLKNAWEEGSSKQKFILKPPASARGIGIRVIHKWNQVPLKKPVVVQKYLSRPYLINGSKFDLRLYVYVTSFDPLRIYLFEDGLVRFATCKYSSSMKHLSNRYMHLTNYSINKKSGDFLQNDDATVCQGHKWSLKSLWRHLQENGINTDKIWEQMKDILIKAIISVEQFTNSLVKSNCRRRYCCHELFGFDIMLDDKLRPWVLEVNISPSLHSNSPLDVEIKGPMVRDMFNLAGFLLPDKKQILANAPLPSTSTSSMNAATSFSQDKRRQTHEITTDSRAKHTYFAQHHKQMEESELISFLLDTLTVNDIQMLVESENEASRCGEFQRIFPNTNKKYVHYFEHPRYYNYLLYAWNIKYKHQHARGYNMLESFCRRGLHVPSELTSIPSDHIWSAGVINNKQYMSPRMEIRPQAPCKSTTPLSYSHLVPNHPLMPSRIPSAKDDYDITDTMNRLVVTSKSLVPVTSVKIRASSGKSK